MARWTDVATWDGPTPNRNVGGQNEVRGLVIHIAQGTWAGTRSWCKNPAANVSYHFFTGRQAGQTVQFVDTNDRAWAQRSGNPYWLSMGNEGFTPASPHYRSGWDRLTDHQIESCARVFAKVHQEYGVPLQVTHSPTGRGLGYHRMGAGWGDPDCPGDYITRNQLQLIVRRARQIVEGEGMNLKARNKSYIRDANGVEKDSSSVGHQISRAHQYPHRLVRAMLAGDTRYGSLDAIASPGSEENPKPTASNDPGRDNKSWRYAIQRIWRWAYWTFNRVVRVESKVDTLAAKLDALADAVAAQGAGAGEVARLTAEDVAPYLEIIALDSVDAVTGDDDDTDDSDNSDD